MAKTKNKKADKPMFDGRIMFDGNIQVKIPGCGIKTLRTDLCGIKLQKADPNKELLVLCKFYVNYNEIHTGYIVRMKQYDDMERPCFGLKHEPNADSWTVINYCDVIAWGYADGGLNDPTLWYSCQSTVEEELAREIRRAEKGIKTHAERLAEMKAEAAEEEDGDDVWGEDLGPRRNIKMRTDEDGNIRVNARFRHNEDVIEHDGTNHIKGLFHDCAKNFDEFRKAHPEITEMHYYSDEEL